ncbi:hypothetical protein SADUNF_Sadunf02G0077000 [Salix dunnii]|uniref:Uncharacterized protein n=1 Tax=Salix dunnii TaxID=1413687 RepID=A0A835N6P6_9ROSI|nr:hypothetical protein SADUNF_Sadunf02G0077000 [Salix dunnii]
MAAIDTGLAQAYVMRKLHKEKMEKLEQAEKGILAGTEKKVISSGLHTMPFPGLEIVGSSKLSSKMNY